MTGPSEHPWQVRQALDWASKALTDTGEPALAARMLLAHVLSTSTDDLFVHPERTLTPQQWTAYQKLVGRRARHEPVAYLIGHRPFFDLDLLVDRRVLIPRPETEVLVERALDSARQWPHPRLVDVGTGSGAIAISLAWHLADAEIVAIDRSTAALQLAQENARRHGVSDRIVFLQGDLLTPLHKPANLILANLPYISEVEYADLPPDIRLYEPREALVSGEEGLDAIAAMLQSAPPYLTDPGTILIEIGATQGEQVMRLARRAFPQARLSILPDYARRDRIVRIERIGNQDGHSTCRL